MLKKKFGEILVDMKVATKEQIDQAIKEQKDSGELLGQILLKKNIVTKNDIAKALAVQVDIPFVEKITEQMADPQMLGKVPLKFLRKHIVIPIMFEGQKTLLTSNTRDLQPLDDLALLMGGDVQYAVATDNSIIEAINKYYPLETSKEMMDELQEDEESEFDLGAIEEKDIMEMANDAPIVKLVNHLLFQAVP